MVKQIKFLIDECLTPSLKSVAIVRGYVNSNCIRDLGLRGETDSTLFKKVINEGWTFVTRNDSDWSKLYKNVEIHDGFVLVLPNNIDRNDQVVLFTKMLDVVDDHEDLINKVVSIEINGEIKIEDFPNI